MFDKVQNPQSAPAESKNYSGMEPVYMKPQPSMNGRVEPEKKVVI